MAGSPDENSSFEEWKVWIHDHTDIYFRTVRVDALMLIALVHNRDAADRRIDELIEALDKERQRL